MAIALNILIWIFKLKNHINAQKNHQQNNVQYCKNEQISEFKLTIFPNKNLVGNKVGHGRYKRTETADINSDYNGFIICAETTE